MITGLILVVCPANERRPYFVMPSLIGWAQNLESALWLARTPSQWEKVLHCDNISHWLGENLESALWLARTPSQWETVLLYDNISHCLGENLEWALWLARTPSQWMRDSVTLWQHLSLAGRKPRISSVISKDNTVNTTKVSALDRAVFDTAGRNTSLSSAQYQ